MRTPCIYLVVLDALFTFKGKLDHGGSIGSSHLHAQFDVQVSRVCALQDTEFGHFMRWDDVPVTLLAHGTIFFFFLSVTRFVRVLYGVFLVMDIGTPFAADGPAGTGKNSA